MLPADNETTSNEKETNGKVNGAEASCSSNSHSNGNNNNGADCSKEIRVKVVAEINAEFSTNNSNTDFNGNGNARKRTSSVQEHTSPKRCKSPEEGTEHNNMIGNEEICDTRFGHNNAGVTGDSEEHNSEECSTSAERTANAADGNDVESSEACGTTVKIKSEPETETEVNEGNNNDVLPSSSNSTNQADIKPAVKVEKVDASSTSRESCRFGIRCYRRNPMHRIEEAHPGDHDYRRPSYPTPPLGTPECPFGDRCYRRNPRHFEQFSHPPETDFENNYKNHKMRLRLRRQQQQSTTNGDDSESNDDLDMEDPFSNDDWDSDFVPSGNEDDDDVDEEDYDACDRAEE